MDFFSSVSLSATTTVRRVEIGAELFVDIEYPDLLSIEQSDGSAVEKFYLDFLNSEK
ncbi:hypothetical protein K0M31_001934 [Melipona bicolor]|uniref:Uncharacterized protein n=1 Tax=Melipona bicolor TaxID=60889 RepID=A0AA40GH91_9HYME|nr:hypothetical protein K0M31_001934 [Melipona bicolor]